MSVVNEYEYEYEAPSSYYTKDVCTGCGNEVHGIYSRWTCSACGSCSPYTEPPEGWATEITPEERRDKTIAYD